MHTHASSAAMLDPDWLRAVATEVYSLCERVYTAGQEAHRAHGARNSAQLLAALDQRERLMHRIEPLLSPLSIVRTQIANGLLHDPALEQLVDEIAAWLQSILSATEELSTDLAHDHAELGREVARLDHAMAATHAYRAGEPERAVLDLTR
jgi:hypothetical protein